MTRRYAIIDVPFAPPATRHVTVELPGEPRGKGRPRFARGHVYTPDKTRRYESDLKMLAKVAMRGAKPIEGPLRVEVTAAFSIPSSWPKAKRDKALMGAIKPTCRPDGDNIFKAAADALNGVAWLDDAQIVTATIVKKYSTSPRLTIQVEQMFGAESP
jgi:Holliday junction resolvase RusA-like endonuclease